MRRRTASGSAAWRGLGEEPGFLVPAVAALAVTVGIAVPLASLFPGGRPVVRARAVEAAEWTSVPAAWIRSPGELQSAHLGSLLELVLWLGVLASLAGCATVVALLLARARVLRHEVALRRALGATRAQVRGELLRQGALLAATGSGLGIAVAWGGSWLLRRAWPAALLPWDGLRLAAPATLLALGLPAALVLALSLTPVRGRRARRSARRSGAASAAGAGSRGADRGSPLTDRGSRVGAGDPAEPVAVLQIAAAVVLLTAAGLLVQRSPAGPAAAAGPALDARDTVTLRVAPAAADEATRASFFEGLLARVAEIPGVEAGSVSSPGAWLGLGRVGRAVAACRCTRGGMGVPVVSAPARHHAIGPGFFAAHGGRVVRGREFAASDRAGAPLVALIDEEFARRHFTGDDPIGRRLHVSGQRPTDPWHTIVGIAPTLRPPGLGSGTDAEPAVYLAALQHPPRAARLAARTSRPAETTRAVREAALRLDPGARLGEASTLEAELDRHAAPLRWLGLLCLALAGVAVATATLGVYAAASLRVAMRAPEIGLRRALGATRSRIAVMVLAESLRLAACGVAIGAVGGIGVARGLTWSLGDPRAPGPALPATIVLLLAVAAVAGSLTPARRAARLDPAAALRAE